MCVSAWVWLSFSDPSPAVYKQTKGRGQRPERGFAGISQGVHLAGSSLVSSFMMKWAFICIPRWEVTRLADCG